MNIKGLFSQIKNKFIKPKVVAAVQKEVLSVTMPATEVKDVIINEGVSNMSNSSAVKDKLIEMFIPILLAAAQKEIPVLIKKFLPPEKIEEMVKHLLDTIEEKIKDSKPKWDDITLLPVIQVLREALDVPSTTEIAAPVDATDESSVLVDVASTLIKSITT